MPVYMANNFVDGRGLKRCLANVVNMAVKRHGAVQGDTQTADTFGYRRLGKIVDFRHLNCCISETVQDRVQVAIDY